MFLPDTIYSQNGHVRIKIIAAIVALIFLFLFANQGFRKMMHNRRELKRLKTEISTLQDQNIILKKELALAKHDLPYLERIARKELGLIQPGEIEYRFIQDDPKE